MENNMKTPIMKFMHRGGMILISGILSAPVYAGSAYIYEMGNTADISTAGAGLAANGDHVVAACTDDVCRPVVCHSFGPSHYPLNRKRDMPGPPFRPGK